MITRNTPAIHLFFKKTRKSLAACMSKRLCSFLIRPVCVSTGGRQKEHVRVLRKSFLKKFRSSTTPEGPLLRMMEL